MQNKVNISVRAKNPWFWVGVVGVVFSAVGISPEVLTSWGALSDALITFISNPYQVGCVVIALLGVFVDPTTAGISDSARVLKYTTPYKGGAVKRNGSGGNTNDG